MQRETLKVTQTPPSCAIRLSPTHPFLHATTAPTNAPCPYLLGEKRENRRMHENTQSALNPPPATTERSCPMHDSPPQKSTHCGNCRGTQ
eukprot:14793719-Alexandrium_andersonii.AAC.1